MKLSEEQAKRLYSAAIDASSSVGVNDQNSHIDLMEFGKVCISIGVEIAMKHHHVIGRYEGNISKRSGPAEAIDHD